MSSMEMALWVMFTIPAVGMTYVVTRSTKRFLKARREFEFVDEADYCSCGAKKWKELPSEGEEPPMLECGHCGKTRAK